MQRYYGMDICRGGAFSLWHIAACAMNLPLGSATMASIDRSYSWTITDYKLHDLINTIRAINGACPISYPWQPKDNGLGEFKDMDIEEFEAWYSKPRKEGESSVY